jgi:transcriptional regulator with XRE-family HTH domain
MDGAKERRQAGIRSDVDRRIGDCIRAVRVARGLSQQSVAEALGLSPQQLQKYERGVNRVAVATMLSLARILDVNPVNLIASLGADPAGTMDMALHEHTLLFEYFSRISNDNLRQQVLNLLSCMARPDAA